MKDEQKLAEWHPYQDHIMAIIYRHENQALRIVEHLIQKDFLMDRISIMGKKLTVNKGDDILGIYYPHPHERMKRWARWGFAIGAAWGLVASVISTLASLKGFGQANIFETALWTMTYSAIVGSVMAAGAAFSNISTMLHRMGIPRDQLKLLEKAIKDGKYVIVLQGSREELEPFRYRIEHSGAELFLDFPKDRLEV
ncbi:hypothetical protein ACFL2V_00695 [Pseudomonadota bacterium]